jgi:hypothetical protein
VSTGDGARDEDRPALATLWAGLESMSTTGSMSNAHGTVHLPLNSPASARYVLIWFTRLPAKSPGKYQVSLYKATVDGQA